MKVTYNITEEDNKKYLSIDLIPKTKKRTTAKIIFTICITILTAIFLLSLIAKDYTFATIMFFSLLLLYFIYKSPKFFKKKYLKNINLNEERTIEINDENLVISNPSRIITFNYSELSTIEVISNYFIKINFKPGDSFLIPKSAFKNDIEMIDFVNKIKTNAKIL